MTWKGINPEIGGLTIAMNAVMEQIPKDLLCSLDGASHITVFSDYGGTAKGQSYLTYSFMLVDLTRSRRAIQSLGAVRRKYSLGSRRMAYKSLSDSRKFAALPSFIAAARRLHAHVLTFAVPKTVRTLFSDSASNEDDDALSTILCKYKRGGGQEHLARVLHCFAFSLAGLSSPGQHIDWITDVDQIAPEQNWLDDLADLTANMSSHYLTHDLGNLRVATTRSDDGTRLLEDLCAVPDLFAGAIAETLSHQAVAPLAMPVGLVVPVSPTVRRKAVDVMLLLTNKGLGSLRSTCLCIEPNKDLWRIQARYFHEVPHIN